VSTSRLKEQSHGAWALNEGLTFAHHKRMLWYIAERRGTWTDYLDRCNQQKMEMPFGTSDISSFFRTRIWKLWWEYST